MRLSLRFQEALLLLLTAVLLTGMAGCGGGGGGGGGGTASPPAISVSLAPAGTTAIDQGQAVNFTATVTNDSGNKGVTWSVSGTGCSGAACGSFTNTTATTATYNAPTPVASDLTVSVKATSVADTSKSASSTVVVKPPPSITTTSLPDGMTGIAYSTTLQAAGGVGTIHWTVSAGSLPAGLSLSSSGTISGTAENPGTSVFTVQVTDSAATPVSAQRLLSITVNPGTLTITTTSLPSGVVGRAYSAQLTYSGGTPPITWSVTVGTLPDGLSLNASTGAISGTPTTSDTATFTVTATDSGTPTPQTANKQLSITINTAAVCSGSGNESVLSGQYAFTLSGYNWAYFLAVVGSFTADGTGRITAGLADLNGALGSHNAIIDASASSYSVGSDNRGCATIATSFGTFVTRFALDAGAPATKGRIIEFEDPTSSAFIGAGKIRKQDPTSFSTGLSGNYVFNSVGVEPAPARLGSIGVLTASGGSFTTGEEDVNDAGTTAHFTGLTGTYTGIDTGGRFAATVTVPSVFTSHFVAYMVSGSEIVFVTTDDPATSPVVIGEMRQQSGTFSNASMNGAAVFFASALSASVSRSSATIGTFTGDGSGSAAFATEYAYSGTIKSSTFSCAYSVASNGRAPLSGTSCGTGAPVLYLTAPKTGFLLGTDPNVPSGQFEPQAAGPFDNTSVSGTFFMGTDAVVSQSQVTEVGVLNLDGAGNVTGTGDHTSTTGQTANDPFTDTYSVNSDGTFSIGSSGTTVIGIAISGSKFVMIDQVTSTYPSILVVEK